MGVWVFSKIESEATQDEFIEVLKIATDDIKFNNIRFGRLTNAEDLMDLLDRCLILVKKCTS